jgi:hypothetical protein
MVNLGRLLIIFHIIFLLLAALLFFASFGAFLGEGYMIVSGIVTLILWGVFAALTIYTITLAVAMARGDTGRADACLSWTNALFLIVTILSVVTGLLLAFGAFAACGPLWLSELYHWVGMAGTILGFLAFFTLPLIVGAYVGESGDHARPHRWWVPVLTVGLVALLWGLVWLIPYLILSGDINESTYPARASSPFKLPFPGGESSWVIQGNNSGNNHTGAEQHAWDFRRPCGTPVLAARDGTIRSGSVDTHDANGKNEPNNFIEVDHGDGTIARYLHIQKGSIVRRSGAVRQGDVLAKVGNVGYSLTGHIHFVVEQGGRSIPVTFQDDDVKDDNGIPRTFRSYISGNRR